MDCPFCDELATDLPPRDYEGEIIECPKYGRIRMAPGVRQMLKTMDLAGRVLALTRAKAKTRPGEAPEITVRDT